MTALFTALLDAWPLLVAAGVVFAITLLVGTRVRMR